MRPELNKEEVSRVSDAIKKEIITDEDRKAYFGLIPAEWTRYEGERQEERAKKSKKEEQ